MTSAKEHEIREALAEVMRDRTTVVIAHRPATIALADRVVLIADGCVVATGTHSELLASSQAYREVLAAAHQAVGDPETGDPETGESEADDPGTDDPDAGERDGAEVSLR